MGVVPGAGRGGAVKGRIGEEDMPRLALAAGIGRRGRRLQHAFDVELDGDLGADRQANVDPLWLTVWRDVARAALHAGVADGDGVIAIGRGDRLDLGEDRVVRVIELQKARLGPGDAV